MLEETSRYVMQSCDLHAVAMSCKYCVDFIHSDHRHLASTLSLPATLIIQRIAASFARTILGHSVVTTIRMPSTSSRPMVTTRTSQRLAACQSTGTVARHTSQEMQCVGCSALLVLRGVVSGIKRARQRQRQHLHSIQHTSARCPTCRGLSKVRIQMEG